jgi:hypothetical protein
VKLHRGARLIVTERLLTYLDHSRNKYTVELLEETLRPDHIALGGAEHVQQVFHLSCAGMINAGGISSATPLLWTKLRSLDPEITALHSDAT